MEPPSAPPRGGRVPWQEVLLAGERDDPLRGGGRMGERGWLGSPGEDRALRGDRGAGQDGGAGSATGKSHDLEVGSQGLFPKLLITED